MKNVVYLAFDFFVFLPTIICKNIVKKDFNNDIVEVHTCAP
jgi:hypothetical protein